MGDERSLAEIAADPKTAPAKLQELAATNQELLPIIAKNPATYQELLDWMASLNNPEVDAALASRTETEVYADLSDETVIREEVVIDDKTVISNKGAKTEAEVEDAHTQLFPPLSAHAEAPPQVTERKSAFPAMPAPTTPLPPVSAPSTPNTPKSPSPASGAPSAAVQPPQEKSNRGLWITFIVLAIVAVAAVIAAIWVFAGGGTENEVEEVVSQSTSQPLPTATVTVTPTEEAAAVETPTPEPSVTKFPAPAGSVAASWFVAPSGNIACQMSNTQTVCTIFENEYAYTGYQSCGGSTTFVIKDNSANVDCSVTPVGGAGADVLLYNTSSTIGDYACLSTTNGMNCWNTITGASIAFARQGWVTNNSGAIPQNQYPW